MGSGHRKCDRRIDVACDVILDLPEDLLAMDDVGKVLTFEVTAKRLELLKDAFPRTRQVAVLLNPDNPIGRKSIGILFRQDKLDIGIRSYREEFCRSIGGIGVQPPKILIEDSNLLIDLRIRNICA